MYSGYKTMVPGWEKSKEPSICYSSCVLRSIQRLRISICSTRLRCSSQTAYYISNEVKVKHWSASLMCLRRQHFLPVTGECTCQGSVKAFMKLWINNCRVSETMEIFHEYYMRLSGRQAATLTVASTLTKQQRTRTNFKSVFLIAYWASKMTLILFFVDVFLLIIVLFIFIS